MTQINVYFWIFVFCFHFLLSSWVDYILYFTEKIKAISVVYLIDNSQSYKPFLI